MAAIVVTLTFLSKTCMFPSPVQHTGNFSPHMHTGRLKSCSDYAPIDLVYKTSRDNGLTWSSNVTILCRDGCTTHIINGTAHHDAAYHNSTNQPTPVVMPANGSTPGYVVMLAQRHGRLYTSRSLNDLGTAWEPLNDTGLHLVPGPTPGVVIPSGPHKGRYNIV